MLAQVSQDAPVWIKYIIQSCVAASPLVEDCDIYPWEISKHKARCWRPLCWFILTNPRNLHNSLFGFLILPDGDPENALLLQTQMELSMWWDMDVLDAVALKDRKTLTVLPNNIECEYGGYDYVYDGGVVNTFINDGLWRIRMIFAPLKYRRCVCRLSMQTTIHCISLCCKYHVNHTPFIARLVELLRQGKMFVCRSDVFEMCCDDVKILLSLWIARHHSQYSHGVVLIAFKLLEQLLFCQSVNMS